MSGSNSLRPAGAEARAADSPLALTIYELPRLGPESVRDAAATRTGRLKMFAILLVCAAPVIASYLAYYVIRPDARRNYGELIEPQRPMPALNGVDAQGRPMALESLRKQWLFVSVSEGGCDARCERQLYLQRQLREGLGKDKDRLDWVWLRTDAAALVPTLRRATEAATVLSVDGRELARWLEPAPGHRLSEHLYVVDPMGNWMMRFPADADPRRMRRDLELLLRASNSWDQAGRD
ncbi:MAG: hypothetical protein RJA36_3050 [Pseudomonadota bacterium]|jgi:hypothetical protein